MVTERNEEHSSQSNDGVSNIIDKFINSADPEQEAKLLLDIDLERGLDQSSRLQLFEASASNERLITYSFILIVVNSVIKKDIVIPQDLKLKLGSWQNDETVRCPLELYVQSFSTGNVPDACRKILKIAADKAITINGKLIATKILLKKISIDESCLERGEIQSALNSLALEFFRGDVNDSAIEFLLVLYLFQCVRPIANELTDDFWKCYKLRTNAEIYGMRITNLTSSKNWLKRTRTSASPVLRTSEALDSMLVDEITFTDLSIDTVEGNIRLRALFDFFNVLTADEFLTINEELLLKSNADTNEIEEWRRRVFFHGLEKIIHREFRHYDCNSEEFTITEHLKRKEIEHFVPAETHAERPTKYCATRNPGDFADLQGAFETNHQFYNAIFKDLHRKMMELTANQKWPVQTMMLLIESLDRVDKILQLNDALEILIEYNIPASDDLLAIFRQSTATDFQKKIHRFVLTKTFPGTFTKDIEQLMRELTESNANKKKAIFEKKSDFDSIMAAYRGKSCVFPEGSSINEWEQSDITKWAEQIINGRKDNKSLDAICKHERLAVIYRTVEVTSGTESVWGKIKNKYRNGETSPGYKPRDVQLLAVLLLLDGKQISGGRFAQINTGEGKTTIIAMFAAYLALAGHKIDVVTSSPDLAKRQAKQKGLFYKTLRLTVSDICGKKDEAYLCDIVYGYPMDFEGDILSDEFRKTNTRQGRKFDVIIIDEADNLTIEGHARSTKVTSRMPGMDHLETIFAAIFQHVEDIEFFIRERDDQKFILEPLNNSDGTGYREIPIEGDEREFIKRRIEPQLRKLICDSSEAVDKNFPEIKIPKHLREFVCKVGLSRWIDNAFRAMYDYTLDEDYIIEDGLIKLVDASNTGVVEEKMQLPYALHRYLELKHGLKTRREGLTSNFISSLSFIKRYDWIFGATGTLGNERVTQFLSTIYGVDTIIIPAFKLQQHKELSPIVVNDKDTWYREVVRSSLLKLYNGRAVLIIVQYINQVKKLAGIFKNDFRYRIDAIHLYKTGEDIAVLNRKFQPGDVLIATYACSRGTDIELTDDVIENGGLHVCRASMSINSRNDTQQKGRASRKGQCGTSQLVLFDESVTNIDTLTNLRDEKADKIMDDMELQAAVVETKDVVFQRFCELRDEVSGRNDEITEMNKEAVEERFALWLSMKEEQIDKNTREDTLRDFESFKSTIVAEHHAGSLVKNPYMHVCSGNALRKKGCYNDAIDEYTSAIELDKDFAETAYFNRGYALLAQHGIQTGEDNQTHIEKALDDLKKAHELIRVRRIYMSQLLGVSNGNDFLIQVVHKDKLYAIMQDLLKTSIDAIERAISKKLDVKVDFHEIEYFILVAERENFSGQISEFKVNGCEGFFCISTVKKDGIVTKIVRSLKETMKFLFDAVLSWFGLRQSTEKTKDCNLER